MKSPKSIYLSSIRKALKYTNKDSKKLLNNLKNEVDIFSLENSDATLNDFISNFGSPSDISESFYSNLDIQELKKQKKYKHYIIISITIITIIAIICISHYYNNLNKDLPSYTIDTITEE